MYKRKILNLKKKLHAGKAFFFTSEGIHKQETNERET